jgi:biotin carboxyl carrier protein
VTVDGQTYEVEIDDPRARPVTARVGGKVFRVDVETATGSTAQPTAQPNRPATSSGPSGPSGLSGLSGMPGSISVPGPAPGQQALTAPIPGTIAKLVAKVGQVVQRGDEILTIEAMKMFNVIRSPWAGTVAEVHVTEGKQVAQGEPLVTFVRT